MSTPEPTNAVNSASNSADQPTTQQLARILGAVATAGGGGSDEVCVVCKSDMGKFITTEKHCFDLGGTVIEDLNGPCPTNIFDPSAVAADSQLVVCSVGGQEVYTTAENCKAWDGTILRKATSSTTQSTS